MRAGGKSATMKYRKEYRRIFLSFQSNLQEYRYICCTYGFNLKPYILPNNVRLLQAKSRLSVDRGGRPRSCALYLPLSKYADTDDAKRKQEHRSRLGRADGAIDPEIGDALIIRTVCHPDCQRVGACGQVEGAVTDTLRTIAVFRVGAAVCPVIRSKSTGGVVRIRVLKSYTIEAITFQEGICNFQHCWRSQI